MNYFESYEDKLTRREEFVAKILNVVIIITGLGIGMWIAEKFIK